MVKVIKLRISKIFFVLFHIFAPLLGFDEHGPDFSPSSDDFLVNPYVFFPCFKVTCAENLGCFDPFVTNGYILTLPPYSACPEIFRAWTIRFLTISRSDPNSFQPTYIIKKGSRVAILTVGLFQEYNFLLYLTLAQTLVRKEFDYVVLVDSLYIENPYLLDHVPGPMLNSFESFVNGIVVGRVICNFVASGSAQFIINPKTIRVVGHSAGSNILAHLGEYCQTRYNIKIGHLVGE